ncbi:hypothetical protein LCGC14_3016270, partial [marine sediment metagenome]
HQHALPTISMNVVIIAITAAVPKSCVIIRPIIRPAVRHKGTNFFQNWRMESEFFARNAARNSIRVHLANSDGWKLMETAPAPSDSHLREKFFSIPMPGMSTSVSSVIAMTNRYGVRDLPAEALPLKSKLNLR